MAPQGFCRFNSRIQGAGMMFIRNNWYVAAFDDEFGGAPVARTICGEEVVLYRKTDGQVVAMHDGCPHRLAPPSMGMIEGDNIRSEERSVGKGFVSRCRFWWSP